MLLDTAEILVFVEDNLSTAGWDRILCSSFICSLVMNEPVHCLPDLLVPDQWESSLFSLGNSVVELDGRRISQICSGDGVFCIR